MGHIHQIWVQIVLNVEKDRIKMNRVQPHVNLAFQGFIKIRLVNQYAKIALMDNIANMNILLFVKNVQWERIQINSKLKFVRNVNLELTIIEFNNYFVFHAK